MARDRNDLSNPKNTQPVKEAEWIVDPLGAAMREGRRVAGLGPLSREKVSLHGLVDASAYRKETQPYVQRPATSKPPQIRPRIPLMVHIQRINTDRAYREAYYRSLPAQWLAAARLQRPGEECGYELPAGECSRPVSCRFPLCLGRGARELMMER